MQLRIEEAMAVFGAAVDALEEAREDCGAEVRLRLRHIASGGPVTLLDLCPNCRKRPVILDSSSNDYEDWTFQCSCGWEGHDVDRARAWVFPPDAELRKIAKPKEHIEYVI